MKSILDISHATELRRYIWYSAVIIFCVLLIPFVREFFCNCGMRWCYILLFSFSLSAVLTPIMRLIALKFDVMDNPGGRKIHIERTPLLGGIAIVASFAGALLSNMILDRSMTASLLGGFVVASVSLVDDWKEAPAWIKLMVQLGVVLLLMYCGIIVDLFPEDRWWGQALNGIFTILWIIGITNAMNFIDGMDGLAAGIGAIMSAFLAIVAYQTNQPLMGWIALALMGSCLGFLPFNFCITRTASIYLGDTGSTFIGFTLATLALQGYWADNSRIVSFSAPVLIFWILIFDMAYITVERIVTGKVKSIKEWIDYVGTDHIHHRLYALLGDKRKAVLFIYFLCTTLGISAIVLRYARPLDAILLVAQACLITIIVSIVEYSGRQRPDK